jgi:hypothetical protein
MDAVQYKGFSIVVSVRPGGVTTNSFQVVSKIYRNPEGAPGIRNWLVLQEFASQQAAYEFGLQDARTWIGQQ